MAGVVPKSRSSGRKQWTLHDGPRGSLRRLRNQLASDGCPESQVVLAKQLLEEECDLEVDKKENARLGVYWLIKASEQGHSEATDLLSKCLVTGRGITEHNYLDVKSCINMTQDEKLARKAAREMFASLSNGEDFITSEQLQKRMLEIEHESFSNKYEQDEIPYQNIFSNGELVNNTDSDSDTSEEIDWTTRSDQKNEKLTEDNIVTAAVHYSHGHLPVVNRVLCLTDPNLNALDHIPIMQRSVLHPVLTLRIIYHKFVRFFGERTLKNIFPLNRTDFQLILILLYVIFSSENLTMFIPMALYYSSFVLMLVSTLQMLQISRNFQDFRVWSGLFLTYSGGSLNADEAEFQFIRNNLKPYGQFFLALLLNLSVYPLILQQWIPQSEITFIAFCFTFITLLSFMQKERLRRGPDLLVLFSFAVNVLAKYPYETDSVVKQTWRFLDLKIPTFASYVVGNGIEFCLNFRLLFYIIIPIILIHLASRYNWRGTYKFLIPHCVTLSWLQIVVINSQGATMFGLIRSTLALVGFVLFLPLLGLTTVLLPAVACAKWIVTNNTFYSIVIFVLLAIFSYVVSLSLTRSRYSKYVNILQVSFAIFAGYVLFNSIGDKILTGNYNEKIVEKSISWEQYQNICHQPAWDERNMAYTQISCQKLNDFTVHWQGYINEVKLKSINNIYKTVLDHLPEYLRQFIYCYFGEANKIQTCNEDRETCEMFNKFLKTEKKCNIDFKNSYEYEISVKMQSGIWGKSAEVFLIASNEFTNFTLQLKSNDKIWFNGRLFNNRELDGDGFIGGLKPFIKLNEIHCLACHNTDLKSFKFSDDNNKTDIKMVFAIIGKIIKSVVNILFNNIVIFK